TLQHPQCLAPVGGGRRAGGSDLAGRLDYTSDIATLPATAASLISKLKSEEITTVSCACDAIMQMYLAREAEAQDYHPEWVIAGVGFTETDLGGQIVANNAPEQWARAFGGSPWAAPVPPEQSVAHRAFAEVRPDEEPTDLIDTIYHQVLVI